MSRSRSTASVLALTVVALAAGAPSAGAATPGPKASEAWFRVTVEGIQTTSWTADHKRTYKCDSS